jgi:hypothetical protein
MDPLFLPSRQLRRSGKNKHRRPHSCLRPCSAKRSEASTLATFFQSDVVAYLEKREVRLCSAKQIVRELCSAYAKQSEFLASRIFFPSRQLRCLSGTGQGDMVASGDSSLTLPGAT